MPTIIQLVLVCRDDDQHRTSNKQLPSGGVQTNEKNHSSHIVIIPPEQVMGSMIWEN
jgi:hypothetical protein